MPSLGFNLRNTKETDRLLTICTWMQWGGQEDLTTRQWITSDAMQVKSTFMVVPWWRMKATMKVNCHFPRVRTWYNCTECCHLWVSLDGTIHIPAFIPAYKGHAKCFAICILWNGHMTSHAWQKERGKKISGCGLEARGTDPQLIKGHLVWEAIQHDGEGGGRIRREGVAYVLFRWAQW